MQNGGVIEENMTKVITHFFLERVLVYEIAQFFCFPFCQQAEIEECTYIGQPFCQTIPVELFLSLLEDKADFTSISVEYYYEIIKELITALMAVEGYKTLSHEALVAYLSYNYKEFSRAEIVLIDELRKLRNEIVYRGFFVEPSFLNRNKAKIGDIIEKLLRLVKNDL